MAFKVKHITKKDARKLRIGSIVEVAWEGDDGKPEYEVGIISEIIENDTNGLYFKAAFNRNGVKGSHSGLSNTFDYDQIVGVVNGNIFDLIIYNGKTREFKSAAWHPFSEAKSQKIIRPTDPVGR